jgi:hypothetical protein
VRQTERLRPVLRQISPYALPRIRHARAQRRGDRVTVTWRTDRPARLVRFFVGAGRTGPFAPIIAGRGRTRFGTHLDGVPRSQCAITIAVSSTETGRVRRQRVAIR